MMREWEVHNDTVCHSTYRNEIPYPVSYLDSVVCLHPSPASPPGAFDGIPLSQKPNEMGVIFSIFFLCFLMLAFAFSSRGYHTILLMVKEFFRVKERNSLFAETTGNDLGNRLLLIAQTVLLYAVFVYTYLSGADRTNLPVRTVLSIIGGFTVLLTAVFLLKWVGYKLISYVFYHSSIYKQWMRSWLSLLSFHALVIFVPVLTFCYVPSLHSFSLYLIFLWFLLSRLIIIYKTYVIFFNSLRRLHYLFLYLCAQEIIPLFLLYKGFDYIFNVLENCAL